MMIYRQSSILLALAGGALIIARWRVVGIVIGTLWLGSILIVFGYDFLVI
jgi:hypothetical protein